MLVPNLMFFCMIDFEDKKGFLHNKYQIFYIGTLNAFYKGWLKAELLYKQQILVTVLAVLSLFSKANKMLTNHP